MRSRVKPVQPTEIKDKKIVYKVIAEIRRKSTAAALKRHKEEGGLSYPFAADFCE